MVASMVKLLIKRVGSIVVPVPKYQTAGAVGLDLHAAIERPILLLCGDRTEIPTGLAFAIPAGYEGQVRARSSVARNCGVTLTNGIGTIDPDYRGELRVLLINHGYDVFSVEPMQRIAQLVICPVLKVEPELVDELDATERGSGGFGSTGA